MEKLVVEKHPLEVHGTDTEGSEHGKESASDLLLEHGRRETELESQNKKHEKSGMRLVVIVPGLRLLLHCLVPEASESYIVIVDSAFLKHYIKAEYWAPADSRVLRHDRGMQNGDAK